jgi:hypothetical protein
MGNPKNKETITVESLLRIKRSERPDNEFWDSFEHSFERRRLNALVERKSKHSALLTPLLKFASFAFPVFLVAGLAFLWSESQRTDSDSSERIRSIAAADTSVAQKGPEPAQAAAESLPVIAMNEGQLSSQFVVDAIEDTSRNGLNFRKVLYTPAIHLSAPNGSFYVKDSFSSRNYQVTTADVKFGRNF